MGLQSIHTPQLFIIAEVFLQTIHYWSLSNADVCPLTDLLDSREFYDSK